MKVEVSIGEVFDKLSILSIKMDKIKDPIKNRNVSKEYNTLLTNINWSDYPNKMMSLFDDLCQVNEKLWDIEDGLREKEARKEFDHEFVELARSVYYTNDKRFEIKREINSICNSELTEEKQHEKYQ
jgi:hypothetical protein